jgi:hypothetical protein
MSPLVPRVVLSGHAKFPADTSVRAAYDLLAIVAVVETRHGVILEVEATVLTAAVRDFIRGVLVGACLSDPMEPVLDHLNRYYRGNAKRSIVAAVSDLYQQWLKAREELQDA